MNYKEIEKEATDWYSNQPMGSAVRQNGPAAIEAYIAAAKKYSDRLEEAKELLLQSVHELALMHSFVDGLKAQTASKPLKNKQPKISPSIHVV